MSAEDEIVAMERAALQRWAKGDPNGFLEITAHDTSYFDPFIERRIDGSEALSALYDQIRGQIRIDRFGMIDPRVQFDGDLAVLTFQFASQGSEGCMCWNTTEVYRRTGCE